MKEENEEYLEAAKNGDIVDVIGLSTWKVHQCGNKEEALVKLTNVSSSPKSF